MQSSRYRWVMLSLASLLMLNNGFSNFVLPPVMGIIMEDFHLTYAQAGFLLAAPGIAAAIIALLGGLLLDRYGVWLTMGAMSLILGLAALLRGFADDYLSLVALTFLLGAGTATMAVCSPKIVGLWFQPKQMASANGIWNFGYGLGSFLGLALTVAVLYQLMGGWRGVFIFSGVAAIGTSGLWWLLGKDRIQPGMSGIMHRDTVTMRQAFRRVSKDRNVWLLCGVFFCVLSSQFAILQWLPTILQLKGLSFSMAGMVASVSWIGSLIGNILVPLLSDRLGRRKPFIWLMAAMLGLSILVAGTLDGLIVGVAVFFIGFGSSPFFPIIYTMLLEMRSVGPSMSGTAIGLTSSFYGIGCFIMPLVAGISKDLTNSFLPGIMILAVVPFIAIFLSFPVKETLTASVNPVK